VLLILHHAAPRVQAGKKKLIFTSNLPAPLNLPELKKEVAAVKKLSGETDTAIVDGTSFSIMRQALRDNATVNSVLMAMHFDLQVKVDGSDAFLYTPAMMNSKAVADIKKDLTPNHHGFDKAALETYTVETYTDKVLLDDIIELFEQYSVKNGGSLVEIFLNGCNSNGLGYSLGKLGFVVVCWSTRVRDDAASKFSRAYYYARNKNGMPFHQAFEFAKEAISNEFELRDPDAPVVGPVSSKPAAGDPKLVLPW